MLRPRERWHFYVLLGLITVSGLLDMIGVAAIVPFLAVLSDPASIQTSQVLSRAYEIMAPADDNAFMFLLGFAVLGLIVIGTLVKMFTMYALARFSHMRKYHIGQRLLTEYLRQPYAWFLSRHSSDLIKTVMQEVDQMVGMALVPAMRILAQAVSVFFLVVLLIVVEPFIAVSVFGVLGGAYLIIFAFVRHRLSRIGHARITANTERFRISGEALGGVKEVKVMGLETGYVDRFRGPAYTHARVLVEMQVIGELPRYFLEAVTFGGMILLILILMGRGDVAEGSGALTEVLPVLGLFAVAGLRMLPAIHNTYNSLTTLRAGQAVLQVVHDDLLALAETDKGKMPPRGIRMMTGDAEKRPAMEFKDLLEVRNAHYSYPGTTSPVLNGLNIKIPARNTIGLVGGTGAGKTTLIDAVLGLLDLDEGELLVDGVQIDSTRRRAWQDCIGYVPQQIFLTDDTVAANIAFGVQKSHIDMDAVRRAARLAHLEDFIENELGDQYETHVGERGVRLSGGQRQRIGIARALYHDPEVLIFDEATSALDTLTEDAIMEAVESLGRMKTIIMIAHRLTTVESCDQIFLLERGQIAAAGTYDELIAESATFRSMARVESR